jgi:SET domain-containing protein
VGVELTFDYAGGAPDDAVEDSRTECFCGARNCRGWLLRHVE